MEASPKRQKENKRQRQRRKQKHQERVRSRHEKELDKELSILPGTWEGEVKERKHEVYDMVIPPNSPVSLSRGSREGWCALM